MRKRTVIGCCKRCVLAVGLLGGTAVGWAQPPSALPPPRSDALPVPRRVEEATRGNVSQEPPPEIRPVTIALEPIDLPSALRLAGVENPDIIIARQRVVEALAIRQLAAAQILPTLNAGLNYDAHTGPVQQSSGNILKLNRSSLYVGAGADAVAAGTLNIPGVVYNINIAAGIFAALGSRQLVEQRRFENIAVRNEEFRRVAVAYTELLRAEGRRALALQIRNETQVVASLTSEFAQKGLGSQADADRAATELKARDADLLEAEGRVITASAHLVELLNLDPAVRLHSNEDKVVPMSLVPDPIPLNQLLAMALLQRPELNAQQAAIRQAMIALRSAKLLPFSPTMLVGFSAGMTGGGSDLITRGTEPRFGAPRFQSYFGNFGARNDFDVLMYWSLQNLGVGNYALIKAARSRLSQADLEKLVILNRVRDEVASAYVQTHVRFMQVGINEQAAQAGQVAYVGDYRRVQGNVGLPIALLESLRLSAQARYDYLDSIIRYNEAQFDLYVALGQPPADMLARPVPPSLVEPHPAKPK